jgi:SAM-dependent methyltransferase
MKSIKKYLKTTHTKKDCLNRNCPICNSSHAAILPFYSIRFDFNDECSVSICNECSHVYLSRLWSEQVYAEFYKSEYRSLVGFNKTHDEDLFFEDTKLRGAQIVSFVATFLQKDAHILEIGCGNGGILQAFRDAGYNKVSGIEPNEKEARLAREKYGLDVISGMPDFNKIPDKTFDLVLIVASIDHFTHPREYLEMIKPKIKNTGYIFIDGNDVEAQMNLGIFNPKMDHPSYFSGLTIRRLLNSSGYELIKFSRNFPYFSPLYNFSGAKRDSRRGFQVLAKVLQVKSNVVNADARAAVGLIKRDFQKHYTITAKILKKVMKMFG